MIKNMNSKLIISSQRSTTKPKKQNKVSKQLEQEQNHRNGDHTEGSHWGGVWGSMREKVQGIRSINGRYKIGRGRL